MNTLQQASGIVRELVARGWRVEDLRAAVDEVEREEVARLLAAPTVALTRQARPLGNGDRGPRA